METHETQQRRNSPSMRWLFVLLTIICCVYVFTIVIFAIGDRSDGFSYLHDYGIVGYIAVPFELFRDLWHKFLSVLSPIVFGSKR